MTAAPAPESCVLAGSVLGDYRVLRGIGSGGMAEVYLAEQTSLGRQVAIKVLQRGLATDATYLERFRNEARAVASLAHANIVQIHEVGQIDGFHFIVQEYVRGKNLAQVLKREGALQPRMVLDVLRQVASALAAAERRGIVHRDLKPENLLLSPSGEVKVADFGLARWSQADTRTLTQVGVAMGTPLYMSPEQIEGRPVDSRSDIYSLGVTCYHLLTGRPPHQGETALAIAVQHLNVPPRPLENVRDDIPSGMARVIHRMMAKKPEQRYDSPSQLLAELRSLAAEASEAGWGEGPEHWSLAEWVASAETQSGRSQQLGQLMKASAALDPRRGSRLALGVVFGVAMVGGAGLAAATRTGSYLRGTPIVQVERQDSAWAQIFHAKMAPSEAAWLAVQREFGGDDPYVDELARQGLTRYYLFLSEEFAKAAPVVRQLCDDYAAEDAPETWRAFALASRCVVEQRLGNAAAAREARLQLTPEMRVELRRRDSQLYELLRSAEQSLGL